MNDLGGNNFTQVIVDDILKKNKNIKSNDVLFYSSQRMKEKLSYLDNFEINLKQFLGYDSFYNLSQKDFYKLSNRLLNRVDELLSEILKKYEDIEYFILVGGSSKMKSFFKHSILMHNALSKLLFAIDCNFSNQ